MTAIVRRILEDFDALPPHDQREVAVEILRRARGESEIPEEALSELAADVFHGYDAEETPLEGT